MVALSRILPDGHCIFVFAKDAKHFAEDVSFQIGILDRIFNQGKVRFHQLEQIVLRFGLLELVELYGVLEVFNRLHEVAHVVFVYSFEQIGKWEHPVVCLLKFENN